MWEKSRFSQKTSSNLRKVPSDPGSPGTSVSYYFLAKYGTYVVHTALQSWLPSSIIPFPSFFSYMQSGDQQNQSKIMPNDLRNILQPLQINSETIKKFQTCGRRSTVNLVTVGETEGQYGHQKTRQNNIRSSQTHPGTIANYFWKLLIFFSNFIIFLPLGRQPIHVSTPI